MNPNNYATLEASRRLYEARIVLDGTDMHWIKERDGSFSLILSDVHYDGNEEYPAPPSMAEVWKELPPSLDGDDLDMWKVGKLTCAAYCTPYAESIMTFDEVPAKNTNPTDALIDLLIWVGARRRLYDRRNCSLNYDNR